MPGILLYGANNKTLCDEDIKFRSNNYNVILLLFMLLLLKYWLVQIQVSQKQVSCKGLLLVIRMLVLVIIWMLEFFSGKSMGGWSL